MNFDLSKQAGLVVLTTFLAAGPARAQDTIVTDRPDFTESTATVPLGMLQLEGGATSTQAHGADELSLGELLLRVPVARRIELRFAAGYRSGDGPDGVEDPAVGLKLRLFEPPAAALPEVSFIAETSIPAGSRSLREDSWQPAAKLLLAWELPGGLGLAANLNYTRAAADGERFDEPAASLALGLPVDDRWSSFVEVYGFFPPDAQGGDRHYANAGVTFLIHPDLQLDARVGTALASPSETFAGVGAAVRW